MTGYGNYCDTIGCQLTEPCCGFGFSLVSSPKLLNFTQRLNSSEINPK